MSEQAKQVGQYGEPWELKRIPLSSVAAISAIVGLGDSLVVAEVPDTPHTRRIVACVNALAGIPDVPAFVARYEAMATVLATVPDWDFLLAILRGEVEAGDGAGMIADAIEAAIDNAFDDLSAPSPAPPPDDFKDWQGYYHKRFDTLMDERNAVQEQIESLMAENMKRLKESVELSKAELSARRGAKP